MQAPALPTDETERLRALHKRAILDTPSEERFDRLTRLAQHVFGTPIALVSLVDAERQWFKSRVGLDACETGRDVSFCGHAILGQDIFEVSDVRLDPRFADNPLVTGPPHIRSYAGMPLATPEGYRIGTLCIIADQPRQLSEGQRQALRDLAACVEDEINQVELKQQEKALQQLKNTLDRTLDCVFMFDAASLRFFYVNEGALRLVGCSRAELLDMHPYDIQPDISAAQFHELIAPLLAGEKSALTLKTAHRHKLGQLVPVEISLQYIAPLDDEPARFVAIVRDITDRQQAMAERKRIADLLNNVLAAASEVSIIATDPDGLITIFNSGAERLLGYSAAEMVGKQTPAIVHRPEEVMTRGMELSAKLGRTIEGFRVFTEIPELEGSEMREWTYLHKDGHAIAVSLVVTLMRSGAGQIIGYLGIAQDITERKRVERLQSEFVSTVSHELRTPLTSISGALGLLAGGALGEMPRQTREVVAIAQRNTQRLSHLINDLLDMEKITAGKMHFDMQPRALLPLVVQSLEANRDYGAERRVTFALNAEAPDLMVRVDSQRLMQVLSNLLSNAVKFSPEDGSVEVRVSSREDSARVTVTDHGMGIPAEFRERIFQKFAQADASDTRQNGGTGLGLAITRELLERMGGSIGYESTEGKGASFFFELPCWTL